MKRKFGFFDIFRKNDAEIQYQFAMQNLQNGAYEEAVRLLLLSANQGFPLAQLELAEPGVFIAKNPTEIVRKEGFSKKAECKRLSGGGRYQRNAPVA